MVKRVRLETEVDNNSPRVRDTYDAEKQEMGNADINASLEGVGAEAAKRAGTKEATVIGNTTRAKQMKQIFSELVSDKGGYDNISFAESELMRRFAALTMITSQIDQDIALGSSISKDDFDSLIIATRTMSQLAKTIGTERQAKDVNQPDLHSYLKKINDKPKKGNTYEG